MKAERPRRNRLLRLLMVVLLSLSFLAGPAAPAHADSAPFTYCYSTNNQDCVSTWGYTGQSPWGYLVDAYKNNCTNYATFRLNQNGYTNPGNLGDASSWAANAHTKGLAVKPGNSTPVVGDVAQWNYGHVAYVEWVSADGSQFAISETGWGPITLGGVTYPSMSGRGIFGGGGRHNESAWPDNFIHFNGGPTQPPTVTDADGDGVPDSSDKCPSIAGPQENSGCPWPADSDGDGIDDRLDNAWDTDVNADGRPDVVGFSNSGVEVALNTGTSFAAPKLWVADFGAGAGGWQVANHPRTLVDVNKDGRPDVVGFGEGGVVVALNTGSSFGSPQTWSTSFGHGSVSGGWQVNVHPRMLVDVNADGRPDVVGFSNYGVEVALNTGTGFATRIGWNTQFGAGSDSGGWQVDQHPRSVSLSTAKPIAPPPVPPVGTLSATPTPTISGTATAGRTLTAKPGTWKPSGVTLGYQWLRNGTPIAGATVAKYTLAGADTGTRVSVRVTGSKSGYKTASKTSKVTRKVHSGTLHKVTPKITGIRRVGSTLTAVPGAWGPAGVVLTYQWYRNGHKVTGSASATYVLTAADKGKRFKVKVTGRLIGWTTASRTSKLTGKVKL